MSDRIRFRHLYGVARRGVVRGIAPTTGMKPTKLIRGNGSFIAFQHESGGGGNVQVIPDSLLMDLGNDAVRVDTRTKMFIQGHKGGINDLRWNPFNDNLLATAGNDGTV